MYRPALLLLLSLGLALPLGAQTRSTLAPPRTTPPPAPKLPTKRIDTVSRQRVGDGPSLEFLEYLGEFETTDGAWHDPVETIQDLVPAPALPAAGTTP